MIEALKPVAEGVLRLVKEWEPRLSNLPDEVITQRRNKQQRTIKQIVGHMADSASNNLHRIVHLQYRESPLDFPNYATHGNNDRWIAIQHYQEEDWKELLALWKYINMHYVHVVKYVDENKLDQQWNNEGHLVSLKEMIIDYLRHFRLHLDEIQELINQK
jgi:hypothetical protein